MTGHKPDAINRVNAGRLIFSLILIMSSVSSVSAYIDPGTGGMILGSIWSTIAAVFAIISAFLVRHFIEPIKRRIRELWTRIKNIGK